MSVVTVPLLSVMTPLWLVSGFLLSTVFTFVAGNSSLPLQLKAPLWVVKAGIDSLSDLWLRLSIS